MEHEDDVEGVEFLARDCKGEAHENGVKYHAEFEDENCCHLRRVVFYFVRGFLEFRGDGRFLVGNGDVLVIVVDVLAGVREVVFAWCVFLAALRGAICTGCLEGLIGVVALLVLVVCMAERGECSGAHRHEFDEKEHKDGHERNAFGPVVVCYRARKARICEGMAGRSQKVDERRGYDDAGAKVFRNEKCPLRNPYALMATRVDWEGCPCSRRQ